MKILYHCRQRRMTGAESNTATLETKIHGRRKQELENKTKKKAHY